MSDKQKEVQDITNAILLTQPSYILLRRFSQGMT